MMRTNSIFIIPSTPSSMRGNMSSDRQCTGSGTEHGMSGGREKRRRGRRQRRRRFRARGMSAGAPKEGLRWGGAQTTISHAALGERGSATSPGKGGSAGAPGEGEGRQVGGFVLPVRVGEPETVAARAALALHILALAMPNARAVCIVNFLKWERNGRGHGVHPMMAYEARGQGGENDEEGEMTTRRWW